jgi:DNA-binding transcriptional LysR family regulator
MANDVSWDLYRSLLGVVRHGSLSAAARSLKMTQPTLGRHIAMLEVQLGTALFTRSSSGLMPTATALAMVAHAEAMAASAAAIERTATGAADGTRGTVRIAASEIMGTEVLPSMLASLRIQHPGLVFEVVVSNQMQDLLRRDADIAIRMRRPTQVGLLARQIGFVLIGLYAHRSYVERLGMPVAPRELAQHAVIGFDRDGTSARSLAGGGGLVIDRALFDFRADSDIAQLAALKAGLGIGGCQKGVAARYPELVPVLADTVQFHLEVWLVMHEDQTSNPPVRMVYDHLAKSLLAWTTASAGQT